MEIGSRDHTAWSGELRGGLPEQVTREWRLSAQCRSSPVPWSSCKTLIAELQSGNFHQKYSYLHIVKCTLLFKDSVFLGQCSVYNKIERKT